MRPSHSETILSYSILTRIFDYSLRFLLVFLPFSSFVSVFLTYQMGIAFAPFIKEIALLIAIISLVWVYVQSYLTDHRYRLRITAIDICIAAYIIVMVAVTLRTTGMTGLIYGGRYDFAFLMVYLIVYHGYPFLRQSFSYYIRLFLFSAAVMVFLSGLLKWPLSEDLLLYFGYSGNPSAWDFGGAPPIFHGIDGANVRRFQWLLDWPNTMGAFLIIFSGVFAYYTRFRKEWHFVIAIVLLWIFGMIFYTYSRSALIGIVIGYLVVILMSMRSLWTLYRMQLVAVVMILILLSGVIWVVFADRAIAIVARAGSTQWHSERMITGIKRTIAHPLGQWLASAGPAYRYTLSPDDKKSKNITELDRYYIPESWYIQQFIEWGYLGWVLFLAIMVLIFWNLILTIPLFAGVFAGVGVMNLFLHTFESSIVSLSLFILVGLSLAYYQSISHVKK